ncbi:HAD-IIB family hydrolase [Ningiella sp. W23]|uniref:HAD-IIB family hydrolase n=1 Tax=Ningiella sp. W23 TaxID=3023715 RepID=UPI003756F591
MSSKQIDESSKRVHMSSEVNAPLSAELSSYSAAKLLVFSDLDGTLLDHHDYSFDAALPSLDTLKKQNIPIVLNTSKTMLEVEKIREQLSLHTPFIIENGAAVFIPKNTFDTKPKGSEWQNGYWVKTFASKRSHWLAVIEKLAAKYHGEFESFSKMTIKRICEVTGLDEAGAELASKRMFGEPLLWKGSDESRKAFIEDARKHGASPLLGGRFLHICGESNKGKALTWLSKEYERQNGGSAFACVALGDGQNDAAMLEAADIAIRIASPVNPLPKLESNNIIIDSTKFGPHGWHETIDVLLDHFNYKSHQTLQGTL